MKEPTLYFRLAVRAGNRVKAYLPATKDAFLANPIVQDAICMRLQEMGENLSKVRKEFPKIYAAYADERWHDLIGLRNAISHSYTELNRDAVWELADKGIDDLISQLAKYC